MAAITPINADNIRKACVLMPDYSTSDVDYQHYDPQRNLSALLPHAQVDHVLLNKLTTYKQLKELSKKGYDIFINLCGGYLDWSVPSIDVIHCLDLLQLPYTGPSALLYDPTKELMKYVAFTCGVATPAHVLVSSIDDLAQVVPQLQFPLFVKPSKAGDSLGIDEASKVHTESALREKTVQLLDEYGPLLVEEYVDGREFTVLVIASPDPTQQPQALKPIEYIFPEGTAYKTYALKTSALHPSANIPVADPQLDAQLRDAALRIFNGFNAVGYARMDFRMDAAGRLFFLEINFTCSVFYTEGYEGSADYIVREDGIGQAGFLQAIINEGLARYARLHKPYRLQGSLHKGYGIYATRNIAAGEIIFHGEGSAQRIITRRFVETHWDAGMQEMFRRYAWPISREVFILWDDNPASWAPQNHSCAPNTAYDGLDVKATRIIGRGEELTLDYATFLDEHMEPFTCHCGAENCRGRIVGEKGNSVTRMEEKRGVNDQPD